MLAKDFNDFQVAARWFRENIQQNLEKEYIKPSLLGALATLSAYEKYGERVQGLIEIHERAAYFTVDSSLLKKIDFAFAAEYDRALAFVKENPEKSIEYEEDLRVFF